MPVSGNTLPETHIKCNLCAVAAGMMLPRSLSYEKGTTQFQDQVIKTLSCTGTGTTVDADQARILDLGMYAVDQGESRTAYS